MKNTLATYILPSMIIVITLCFFTGCQKKQRTSLKTCQSHKLTRSQISELEKLLSELTQTSFGTGAALAIDDNGAMTTIQKGTKGNEGGAVNAFTLFNIASVSKTLTGARMVALAKEKNIELDDRVNKYLPGILLLNKYGANVTRNITIRDLLRHRSGLPHQPRKQLDPNVFENKWTTPELLTILTRDWTLNLTQDPGKYQYSNMGYVFLGAIIERIDGCPFGTSMENYLSGIGLHHFSYKPSLGGSNMASGKIVRGDKITFNPPGWYGSAYAFPFSGAWISMTDLARFGKKLGKTYAASSIDGETGCGLGIFHKTFSGHKTLEHDGSCYGFLARLIIIPEQNIVLAVACNGGNESPAQSKDFKKITDSMLAVVLTGSK